jgi:hypothetical protein
MMAMSMPGLPCERAIGQSPPLLTKFFFGLDMLHMKTVD